jgi:SAM-dependent methyltransferase
MQVKAVPETPLEWLALQFNKVPLPLLHGQMFPVISKAVLVAADRGIFSQIGTGKATAEEIAATSGLSLLPLRQLLLVLASCGYLSVHKGQWTLSAMARKWLLLGSPTDLTDLLIYNNRVVWKWMEHLDQYLETGEGIDYHALFGKEEWSLYQKAMLAVARSEVTLFAKKCPLRKGAQRMLDIGGAHGLHVKAIQDIHPQVSAQILDLPGAWDVHEQAVSFGVERIEGNVIDFVFPEATYDLVLMSSLAHHFKEEENRLIARKVASALKPGGIYVINEFVNPGEENLAGGLVGVSSNLFFGLTSTSGTWTISETQSWQAAAGLTPFRVIGYTAIPGRFQIVARKP